MSGPVDWQFLMLLVGFASGLIAAAVAVIVWVVRLTWWLSEEFRSIRHDFKGLIDAATLKLDQKIDAVDDRDTREHADMQKQISALSVQLAKRR